MLFQNNHNNNKKDRTVWTRLKFTNMSGKKKKEPVAYFSTTLGKLTDCPYSLVKYRD